MVRLCGWDFVGVKLGSSHWGKNVGWGFSRIGCWGRYWAQEGWGNREVEKTTKRGALCSVGLLNKCHSGDQIKKTEMDRACGTCRGDERCTQGFGGETSRKEATWTRRRWEDNIKMDLREVRWVWAWTGSMWLRVGTGGEMLWMR